MKSTPRCFAIALALSSTAMGGADSFENFEAPAEKPQAFVPAVDGLAASYEFQDGLDFDDSSAELDASRFSLVSFLSRPIDLGGDWSLLPALQYSMTSLDFSNTPAGFPMDDEDLHQVAIHVSAYHHSPGSRWLYGGWGRASFASDCQDIGSDDFYFDLAVGGGYRVTDRFMLGLGVVGLELGSDAQVLAGPGFYWKPNDVLDVSLIGALFNTTWRPSEDWAFALRARPFGNSWNIDNGGESQQVDLSSYTVRLHAERRLYRDMWLSVGVGYSFANDLELRDSSGDRLFKDDLGGGLSSSIGLRVRTW